MPSTFQIVAGGAAALISVGGFVPYAVAIVRREARPSAATWLIWTAVGTVLGASHFASGARASLGLAAVYVLGPLVTAVLALKYGERGWTRLEIGCLAGALLSLPLWALTGSPLVALGLNIFIDLLGAVPTIRKVWRDPASEHRLSWILFFLGNAVNLLAVESWTLGGAGYPAYLAFITFTMSVLVLRQRRSPA
jgi:hypothetical protein